MNKEELEKLLKKKEFNCSLGVNTVLLGSKSDIYYKELRVYCNNLIVLSILINGDRVFIYLKIGTMQFPETLLDIDTITEQKLDKILSQCTKIKTSFETIEQIAKGIE